MSHSENTARKYDDSLPKWLALKLWVKSIDPEDRRFDRRFDSRQAENRQWKREIEMEWRSALKLQNWYDADGN